MRVATPIRPPTSDQTMPGEHDSSTLGFDQSSRPSESMSPVPSGGVPRALREAAENAGIDPVAELFNEALAYAQEGHLRLARERLQMLLCMAPDDGEAQLMLAQVHVAGRRWPDALAALDEAKECGVTVRRDLRLAVEEHLAFERARDDEQRQAVTARNQGEVMSLRGESRRFRSENAELAGRVAQLEGEVRKWAWATLGVSVLAIGFVGGTWWYSATTGGLLAVLDPTAPVGAVVVGGSDVSAPVEVAEVPSADPAAAAVPTAPVAAAGAAAPVPPAKTPPPSAPAVASAPIPAASGTVGAEGAVGDPGERAREALRASPDMAGATVELKVGEGGLVTVTGTVVSYRQRKKMERLLGAIDGIEDVDATATIARSRVEGTTHVVARGDTLSHIAYAYYGNSALTKPIEDANHVTPSGIRPGMKLIVPPLP